MKKYETWEFFDMVNNLACVNIVHQFGACVHTHTHTYSYTYIYKVSKVGDRSRGQPEGYIFNCYSTEM